MSCTCGSDEKSRKKLQILQKKYDELRRNHRKLLGVTVELTEALEDFVKGGKKPDVNNIDNTLSKCIKIYPNLFEKNTDIKIFQEPEKDGSSLPLTNNDKTNLNAKESADETSNHINDKEKSGKLETDEKVNESEKEYYEGFWSRPRIPRTPQ